MPAISLRRCRQHEPQIHRYLVLVNLVAVLQRCSMIEIITATVLVCGDVGDFGGVLVCGYVGDFVGVS